MPLRDDITDVLSALNAEALATPELDADAFEMLWHPTDPDREAPALIAIARVAVDHAPVVVSDFRTEWRPKRLENAYGRWATATPEAERYFAVEIRPRLGGLAPLLGSSNDPAKVLLVVAGEAAGPAFQGRAWVLEPIRGALLVGRQWDRASSPAKIETRVAECRLSVAVEIDVELVNQGLAVARETIAWEIPDNPELRAELLDVLRRHGVDLGGYPQEAHDGADTVGS